MKEEIDLSEFYDSEDPVIIELQMVRLSLLENNRELEEIKIEAQKTKWACRSVALLLAVIVFFGIKLTIK